jgi:hypothetical protein
MKRAEQLQPPVEEPVRVVVCVEEVDDPALRRRLAHWIEKLLNEHATPEEGPRS